MRPGSETTTGLLITGGYPGIKLVSTTAISDVGITYAKSGKAYCVGAAIGEASDHFVFWDATAASARGRIRSTGEWEFLGAVPTTTAPAANQVFIGGGQIWSGGNARIGGTVFAKEVKVQVNPFADYVFAEGYTLRSLEEVEAAIKQNKHLPGVPAAAEFEKNGLPVSEMLVKQMEKIEELTLYAISAHRQIEALSQRAVLAQRERDESRTQAKAANERLQTLEERLQTLEKHLQGVTPATVP